MSAAEAMASPAPKVDPETLALRAQPRPVTRLNRRMLAALAGGLAVLVLGASMWALQSSRRERSAVTELFNVDRVARAEDLERLPRDYAGILAARKAPSPVLGEPLPGDLGPAIVKAQQPTEMRVQGSGVDPAEAERLAADEAARSSVFFRMSGAASGGRPGVQPAAGSGANVPPATGGTAAMASALAALQAANNRTFNPTAASAVQAPALDVDLTAQQNRQSQKEAFLEKAGDGATRNTGSLQLPSSPYQVMAGTIIPAALVTGINSDLPGQVIASVTEAVFDTATGKHLLIPQGSRLVGRYDSQVAFGQRRVLLVWTRLTLPDASSVALDRLPGIDPAGYAGLEDGIDWHWDRILAGAALSTLLGLGAELAAPQSQIDREVSRIMIAAREGVQDTANEVGQEITKRNASIQPTLTIRPGYRMRVMANKDLVLRPYQPLFLQRGASQ